MCSQGFCMKFALLVNTQFVQLKQEIVRQPGTWIERSHRSSLSFLRNPAFKQAIRQN